jgi:hypothetical protein
VAFRQRGARVASGEAAKRQDAEGRKRRIREAKAQAQVRRWELGVGILAALIGGPGVVRTYTSVLDSMGPRDAAKYGAGGLVVGAVILAMLYALSRRGGEGDHVGSGS